jgi:hypothetical protein
MTTRAQYYANKKHDQREFGDTKPTLKKADEGTVWIAPAVMALDGLVVGEFHPADYERFVKANLDEARLRELSRRGLLRMRAARDDAGKFVRFEWTLTASAVTR